MRFELNPGQIVLSSFGMYASSFRYAVQSVFKKNNAIYVTFDDCIRHNLLIRAGLKRRIISKLVDSFSKVT